MSQEPNSVQMRDPDQHPTAMILTGPKAPPNGWWCAVCCFLHQHRVAQMRSEQEKALEGYRAAQAQERQYYEYRIPNTSGYPMYAAVTLATSPQFPNTILPVCWQHLDARMARMEEANTQRQPGSNLILGKSYSPKGKNDDLHDSDPESKT